MVIVYTSDMQGLVWGEPELAQLKKFDVCNMASFLVKKCVVIVQEHFASPSYVASRIRGPMQPYI